MKIFLARCWVVFVSALLWAQCGRADPPCAFQPLLSPPRLLVRYGEAAEARCSIPQPAGPDSSFDWEVSLGHTEGGGPNETEVLWRAASVTRWETKPRCFYTDENDQCDSILDITVYRPPDSVSISLQPPRVLQEGEEFWVTCDVHGAAPMQNVTLTMFRGHTPIGTATFSESDPELPTKNHSFPLKASREQNQARFWCRAQLELSPNISLGVQSGNLTTEVQFAPQRVQTEVQLNITEGDHVMLDCYTDGNPAPEYTWTPPPGAMQLHLNTSTLHLPHVSPVHQGTYLCTASNSLGSMEVTFLVAVKVDMLPIVAGLVSVAVLLLAVALCLLYTIKYRHTHTGHYRLADVFRRRVNHSDCEEL